jgi:hypothetical protein
MLALSRVVADASLDCSRPMEALVKYSLYGVFVMALTGCYDASLLADGKVESAEWGGSGRSAGVGRGGASGSAGQASIAPAFSRDELRQQAMVRWNENRAIHPTDFEGATQYSFEWPKFDQFPHPTFRGGSEAAYGAFADLLLTYLHDENTFEFLSTNDFFDERLLVVFSSGQVGLDTSFRELVNSFSSDDAFGDISTSTRAGLASIAARLEQSE